MKNLRSVIFLLFIVTGVTTGTPVFADHMTASVFIPEGTSVPGCETANECFTPYEVTVDVGGEVEWSNDDTAAHTVTSGTAGSGPSGFFDSSLFMAGATFSHKFEDEGEYPYFCMVHPWMQGIVTVQAEIEGEHEEEQYMEGAVTLTGMLSDGTTVSVWATEPTAGERMEISIKFEDSEHVNYDILVTQNDQTVLDNLFVHHHDGSGDHETAVLNSSDPVDITITFQGYGVDKPKTGPIGEVVIFSNVVPEFGIIATMILAVTILLVVAITVKSKLSIIQRF